MHIQHTALATAATTASLVACTITKIQGLKVAANDRFLQLHDTKATPAAAAVPVRVWPIYGTAPFGESFIVQPVALTNGATFVVSTTAATYTATAETIDITVDGNATFDSGGVQYAGDYTTGVESLAVWTGGQRVRLLRLEFTALTAYGATLYAKVFDVASPAVGYAPITQISLANNTSVDRAFNMNMTQFSPVSVNTCFVVLDTVAGNYAGDYLGTNYAIKATYI